MIRIPIYTAGEMATAPRSVSLIKHLRRRGYSIPEISARTEVPKTTVQRYSRDVTIAPQCRARWLARRNASKIMSERAWRIADTHAERLVGAVTKRDMALIGASLYWAEGAKKDFTFTNTDARMVALFSSILRNAFGVPLHQFKVSLRIYEDLDRSVCLRYWSRITGVHLNPKTTVSVLRGRKVGKLPYGMCRVRVQKSGWLLKELFSIINKVSAQCSPRSSMDRTVHS
jgi:hypothetical protein